MEQDCDAGLHPCIRFHSRNGPIIFSQSAMFDGICQLNGKAFKNMGNATETKPLGRTRWTQGYQPQNYRQVEKVKKNKKKMTDTGKRRAKDGFERASDMICEYLDLVFAYAVCFT